MERVFSIKALNRIRVESRILQVLDHHAVSIESFSSTRIGDERHIAFMSDLDDQNALRTCDLLRRLQDVQSIDSFPCHDGICRTMTLLRISCDEESRLPMLQTAASLGAKVVAAERNWIALQAIGSVKEIDALRDRLLPHGSVETISAASAAVRNDKNLNAVEKTAKPIAAAPELYNESLKQEPAPLYGVSI